LLVYTPTPPIHKSHTPFADNKDKYSCRETFSNLKRNNMNIPSKQYMTINAFVARSYQCLKFSLSVLDL
jgi:hypothetical protein